MREDIIRSSLDPRARMAALCISACTAPHSNELLTNLPYLSFLLFEALLSADCNFHFEGARRDLMNNSPTVRL